MNEELRDLLIRECSDRGLSWRQASIEAGLDQAAISRFIRGTTPSPDSCRKLSAFFGIPEDDLLMLVGHKSQRREDYDTRLTRLIAKLLDQLTLEEQEEVLEVVRALASSKQRQRTQSTQPKTRTG